jgi:hypothetical protein
MKKDVWLYVVAFVVGVAAGAFVRGKWFGRQSA